MNEEKNKKQFDLEAKIILKELRETFNALKIIKRIPLSNKAESIDAAYSGCNELIAIFVKSLYTASKGGSGTK